MFSAVVSTKTADLVLDCQAVGNIALSRLKVRELESSLELDEVTLFLPAAYHQNRDSLDGVVLIYRS